MNQEILVQGLISYLCFIIVLTFHEAAHAWMALRRGDDTAKLLGRITLNPASHIDPLGTVFLPLMALALGATGSGLSSFIIGWGKPVPFNPSRLKNPLWDGVLIAMAGPAMNVLVAMAAIILCRVGGWMNHEMLMDFCTRLAYISMYLCFFNLIPIPPLDGSHVLRYVFNIGEEAYMNMARFGFIILIIVIQIPAVSYLLSTATILSVGLMIKLVGLG